MMTIHDVPQLCRMMPHDAACTLYLGYGIKFRHGPKIMLNELMNLKTQAVVDPVLFHANQSFNVDLFDFLFFLRIG